MIKTCFIEQITETESLEANLILCQYNLDLMSRFLRLESNFLKSTQKQIAQQ